MKGKDLVINAMPFLLWTAFFVLELIGAAGWKLLSALQLLLIILLPTGIGIYNAVCSADYGEIFAKNIFMGVFNVLGMLFANALSDSFIYPDPEAGAVMEFYAVIMLAYMLVFTLICCGIKAVLKKRK